jgi:hypothetical protein
MTVEKNLRSAVRQERSQIANLLGQITTKTPSLRELLDLASSQLDIIEHCLNSEVLAGKLLNAVSIQTKYVADMVGKFGPDIREF